MGSNYEVSIQYFSMQDILQYEYFHPPQNPALAQDILRAHPPKHIAQLPKQQASKMQYNQDILILIVHSVNQYFTTTVCLSLNGNGTNVERYSVPLGYAR